MEPYYPINDMENMKRYERYRKDADKERKVIFGGRLGSYQYYDMQDTVKAALDLSGKLLRGY